MALSRRSGQRFQASIWPGFVDAMTALLLVLMFVLTIFMVAQFALRETITGQESELDQLSAQIIGLADALGLEQQRAAQLEDDIVLLDATLDEARNTAKEQVALIASLTAQTNAQTDQLAQNQAAISSFESQVATLLAQRDKALGEGEALSERLAEVDAARLKLITEQEALQLALASARDEIDLQSEAARLAAARREALDAMVADLRTRAAERQETLADALARLEAGSERIEALAQELSAEQQARLNELAAANVLRERLKGVEAELSAEEAQRLADAAAAEALRERLKNADSELTAMTLALEAQRKKAEDTLTLLAAAEAAKGDLDSKLAAALLSASTSQEGLEEAKSAFALMMSELEGTAGENELLQAKLAKLLAAKLAAEAQLEDRLSAADQQAVLLATAQDALAQEEAESAEGLRKLALLNEQVAALRAQLNGLQGLLDISAAQDVEAQVQLQALGSQLNTALARVASEEKRRRKLEEAERKRLEREAEKLALTAQDLEGYKSDFFGQLRELLGNQEGVRIVGDRFVFSSEVLFSSGAVDLLPEGKAQIAQIATILTRVSDKIPPHINWVIRVDGHTDNQPVSGAGRYRDNWELSQGRALSVVRYMSEQLGIAPNRLSANGFGEFQPIDPANTPEARAQNRRIELKFTER